jgi:RNA polymerase sigma-70 factor, ECF subfamily
MTVGCCSVPHGLVVRAAELNETGRRVVGTNVTKQSTADRFEAVALPFIDVVYDSALRLTGDPTAAQDLTQDTFLRAFRAFDSFEPGSNCRAWLLRIAYNAFCNDYRKRRRFPQAHPVDDEADLLAEQPTEHPGPEEQTLRLLDQEALHRALAQLPEDFRMAVTLVDIHGLTCAEAAQVMGTPRGTVLSRLHRARGRLRRLLLPERLWQVDADEL